MISSISLSCLENPSPNITFTSLFRKGFQWIRHYVPDLHKIQTIALQALQLTAVAFFTYFFPWTSIIISIGCLMGQRLIQDMNSDQFKKQLNIGMDNPACMRALKAVKTSLTIQKIFCQFDIVRLATFALFLQVQIPLCILLIGVQILIWKDNRTLAQKVAATKSTRVDAFLCAEELHKLQKIYPNLLPSKLYPKCILERVRRPIKAAYLKWQKQCVSDAWETLLSQGKFQIRQGLEGDCEIFDPLCRLAVLKEIQSDLKLNAQNCPPTLIEQMDKLNNAKAAIQELSSSELSQLNDKLIKDEFNKDDKLHGISMKICDIASHMLQSQELFQKPIIVGSERYCLKKFKFIPYAKLQVQKVGMYRDKLFFTG